MKSIAAAHTNGTRRVRAWLALATLAPLVATAQTASDANADRVAGAAPFVEVVNVNLVNVQVHVTDRNGDPITGLTIDDFAVFEDKRPVTLTNFEAVADNRPVAGGEQGPVQDALPTHPGTVQPGGERSEQQQLHLILYFDNLFLRPFNRNRVRDALDQFLVSQVVDGDRIMLATYERTLHVRQPFTDDRRLVMARLDDITTLSAFAVQTDSARRQTLNRIEQSRSIDEALFNAESHARVVYDELLASVRQLHELTASLAGIPGRKAIVYVSDGIPMTAAEDLFFVADQQFSGGTTGQLRSGRFSARTDFRELTQAANAAGVTFYTLDAGGARSHSSLSAESGGAAGGALRGSSEVEADFARFANEQAPMLAMADDTGGVASINTSNIRGALERIGDDLGNYYVLGYNTGAATDGGYRRIEVEVPGCQRCDVRHRNGYRSRPALQRVEEGTRAALLYGTSSNPLNAEVEVAQPRRQDGEYLMPIEVRVPFASLTLVPQQDVHYGRLRVVIGVADSEGNLSPLDSTVLPIEIPQAAIEQALTEPLIYTADLLVHAGEQQIAVGVHDELSGRSSYLPHRIRIGSPEG